MGFLACGAQGRSARIEQDQALTAKWETEVAHGFLGFPTPMFPTEIGSGGHHDCAGVWGMGMSEEHIVRIVLPPVSDDEISNGLRALTAAICRFHPELAVGWGLGGEHGYGADFSNDVFEMRRFYWGDCLCGALESDDDVDHAADCPMELPNFRHKATGFEVRWYKWIGRDNEIKGSGDWRLILGECFGSLARTSSDSPMREGD